MAIFGLASAWNYLDRLILSNAAPRVRAEFHLSNADYGWLVSAFSIAYTAASPATGWFLDWLGLETGIVCAVALWSLSAAICGWTQTFGQLVGARVLLGIFESAGIPAAGKLNAIYLEPRNRALGAAVTQVGLSIGGIAAPLLVAAFTGWRSPFFVASALGFAWIPVWIFVRWRVHAYQRVAPQRTGANLRLFRDPLLIRLTVANLLWMGIYSLWSNWTTLFLTQSFRLDTAQAAAYAWFPPVASTLGAFTGGWISKAAIARGRSHVSARVFGTLVSAIGCLCTLLVPLSPTPLVAMFAISASYFWVTAGSVNIYTIPVDIWGGEHAGTAISALVFAYGVLQTVISPAIGAMVDRWGFVPVCWLVAMPPLAGWALLRSMPRASPDRMPQSRQHGFG